MLIVEMNGGLGNQMFQFALYRALSIKRNDVYLYDSVLDRRLNNSKSMRVYQVFELKYNVANPKYCYELADVRRDPFSRMRRRLLGKRAMSTNFVETNLDENFTKKVFELDDAYIQGYWQTEKYFLDVKDEIRNDFTFSGIEKNEVRDILDLINDKQSVSIHLRCGDYIHNPAFNKLYGGICTNEYYNKAIEIMRDRLKFPYFVVFSDDIQYAKEKFTGNDFMVVDQFYGTKAHYDMFLMSQCKHNIIANSSFSWWGAWLNAYDKKIVIAPSKWTNDHAVKYTVCDNWIRI